MAAGAIERVFQGRERPLDSGIVIVSGLVVPEVLTSRNLDQLVSQVANGLEKQRGFMRPLSGEQIRKSVERGRFAVSMKSVQGETVFLAVAQSWQLPDSSIQEVGTVMKLSNAEGSSGQPAEVTREATLLASMKEGITDVEALAATTNAGAQRLFRDTLGTRVKGERPSDYVFVDGDERKERVQMTIFDLRTGFKTISRLV